MNTDNFNKLVGVYTQKSKRPNGSDNTLAENISYELDNDIRIATAKDIVIIDRDAELLHCICINDDPISQGSFPVKVISAELESIQRIEGIFSRDNFAKLLASSIFANITTEEQRQFISTWADSIKSQPRQDNRPHPYYKDNPDIIANMPSKSITRDDNDSIATAE